MKTYYVTHIRLNEREAALVKATALACNLRLSSIMRIAVMEYCKKRTKRYRYWIDPMRERLLKPDKGTIEL